MVRTDELPIELLACMARWRLRGLSAACLTDLVALVLMEEPRLSAEERRELFGAFKGAIWATRDPGERRIWSAS